MEEVTRILDADADSLNARVRRALPEDAERCIVGRFTYWYTGRPPIHEAIVYVLSDASPSG
jgi:hypothetical protein